jgi:DNA-binding transcriptional LysR family regulator
MLDVRRMRVLLEVATRGSMSAAADALNYTPSAVSQQIATLERESGVALVERGPRSITLTDAGRALAEHAEIILARLEIAEMEVREIAGLHGGRLRLATFRSAGETIMAHAITRFHSHHPKVELTLTEGEPEDYLPLVRSGKLDVGLGFEYDHVLPVNVESSERRLLMEDRIGVALPLGHRLAGADTIDLAELRDEAWIGSTPRSSVHAFTQNLCRTAGIQPQIKFQTDDYHVAQAHVATGMGIAFLPELAAANAHPGVLFRHLGPRTPVRRIFAVYRAGGLRSPTTSAMVDVLGEVATEASTIVQAPAATSA